MRYGIITAMEDEMIELKKQITQMQIQSHANLEFLTGKMCNKDVVLVRSGIGKVQAAIVATLLFELFKIDLLINTGSAGGMNKSLHIGDVVVANQLSYNDADLRVFGYAFGQLPQKPLFYKTNPALLAHFLHFKQGLIVSGDSFISSLKQKKAIQKHFPQVLACDMESTSIAQVAFQYQKDFLIIRAISDNGDEKASVNFEEFVIEAGKKSAQILLNFLKA
jgi:adenosylhomocysteine nucleosidase